LIQIEIPGRSTLDLRHLVLDLNGTVAVDGVPKTGVAGQVATLSSRLTIYLVTADTHGQAEDVRQRLRCQLVRIEPKHEASQKRTLVEQLGAAHVVAIGNGVNDAQMLSAAALGIAILGQEGLAVETLRAADLVVGSIRDALDLLLHPRRLVATLRC
jgi:P-type E1-E2 ATPase